MGIRKPVIGIGDPWRVWKPKSNGLNKIQRAGPSCLVSQALASHPVSAKAVLLGSEPKVPIQARQESFDIKPTLLSNIFNGVLTLRKVSSQVITSLKLFCAHDAYVNDCAAASAVLRLSRRARPPNFQRDKGFHKKCR